MHVLMISLDPSLLGVPHGNTVQRHLDYAKRLDFLTIVTYNPASAPHTPRQFADNFIVYPTNTRPLLYPWAAYRQAVRVHRQRPVDVVTTQDPFASGVVGLLLKWRLGLPLDVQVHSTFFTNPDWLDEHPLRNRLLLPLGKFVVRHGDTHRVLTEYEKQVYMRMGIPGDRIQVINTPLPTAQFAVPTSPERLAELRRTLEIEPDAPVVLWVGMPVKFKNIDLLLDAFALVHQTHPAARLVLVGDFSAYPQYVARADPAWARFAGHVPHDQLPAYYALADIYLHSSIYEGVPRVLIEALASGRPVVSTRHVGSEAVVRDGETGLLTDHTPEALVHAVETLLDDPARGRALGAAGQRDVLVRYDYETKLDAVIDSFRRTRDVARGR